jgi:hypothetical protein
MDYVVWRWKNEGNSCLLLPPENVPRDWELYKGVPRAAGFPEDALFRMSDDHRKNMGLTDNLMNVGTLVVASKRLKEFFEARAPKNVEYLPVAIVNHKKRVASPDYFIVHPIVPQDCLDAQASGAEYSDIIPGDVVFVDALVIDPGRVDPGVDLFRIQSFGEPVLIRRQLAIDLLEADFTGLNFLEIYEL